MENIVLKSANFLSTEEVESMAGRKLTEKHFDTLFERDIKIFKPNGDLLLVFKKNVFSEPECRSTYYALRDAAKPSFNRGISAGSLPEEITKTQSGVVVRTSNNFRYKVRKKDGTVSSTLYANKADSGIIGYFDKAARTPYCRQTAFTHQFPKQFRKATPFIKKISDKFLEFAPEQYNAQKKICDLTSPDFIIPGTVYTTVTVNKNFCTAVHQDVGDLAEGFGNLTVLEAGHYDGCYLCMPQFKIAVNCRMGDLLLMDVHEWHGNTPFVGKKGTFHRISLVCYYREKMMACKSAKEELQIAKKYTHELQDRRLRGEV